VITRYHVLETGGAKRSLFVDWPAQPSHEQFLALIGPILNNEPIERVRLHQSGHPFDMFVSKIGHVRLRTRPPLGRNEEATKLYRAGALARNPGMDPEMLSWIAGPAVVFDRQVWF